MPLTERTGFGRMLAQRRHFPALLLYAGIAALPVLLLVLTDLLSLRDKLIVLTAVVVTPLLLKYPEILLALFLSAGKFKGSEESPSGQWGIDVTVLLGVLVVVSIFARVILKKEMQRLPRELLLYLPFVGMMLISLSYTPELGIGLDKTMRFVILTGLAVVAPFVLLTTPETMKRFLLVFIVTGLILGINSFRMLGGEERLVALSGHTIQLGYEAAIAIIVICYLVLPKLGWIGSIPWYAAVGVLSVALIGSGARSATIATAACVGLSFFLSRRTFRQLVVALPLAVIAVMSVNIPAASYQYLGTIFQNDPHSLLSFRNDLMRVGMELTVAHPLLGVGIGGYPYYSPNPELFNWPHNLILEVSSELGVIAAAAVCAFIVCSSWVIVKQVLHRDWAYRDLSRTVLGLMVVGLITMLNTGDINDLRPAWLYLSLPFVLQGFGKAAQESVAPPAT